MHIDWPSWLTAIGTTAVAILAIWGDWIRFRIAGPKLELVPHNLQGEITRLRVRRPPPQQETFDEIPASYFHLRVINRRTWVPAQRVRVLLVGILRMGQDGHFHREPINVRQQLTWAPAELSEIMPTIAGDHILDLGFLTQEGFTVTTYVTPNNFRGTVRANEAIRVEFQVEADNYHSDRRYSYEIEWDGTWAADAAQLARHISVREVTSGVVGSSGEEQTAAGMNAGRNGAVDVRIERLPRPLQGIWRILYKIEGAVLRICSVVAQTVALIFSPFLLVGLLVCLWLLAWNHYAPQAPAWIATSVSIVCGGVISLLAMGRPIREDKYVTGLALLFMLIPAALGCWATLQPGTLPSEKLSFVTVLDVPGMTRLEIDPAWQREYPYMGMMRTVIEEKLSKQAEKVGKQDSEDMRFNRRIEMASSMDLVELLLFQQMRWRFEREWDVKVDTSRVFGMEQISIGPRSGRPSRTKKVLTKKMLQQMLPQNKFLDQLPDSYQIAFPEGMRITTEPIDGWPNHALVFEDAYCRIRFKPEGKSLTRGFWLNEDPKAQPFISHLRVGIETTFKWLRVGTSGTTRRKEWIQTLLQQMKEPKPLILSD